MSGVAVAGVVIIASVIPSTEKVENPEGKMKKLLQRPLGQMRLSAKEALIILLYP
jgi:hypothetical protein